MTSNGRESSRATPLRLFFVSDHLGHAEGRIHGATTYFLNVLPALKRADIQLTVCFLRNRHPIADELESEGIRLHFLNRGKWDVRALSDLTRLIRSERADLVHAAGMKGILLGRMAARRTGTPNIIHLHDANPLDPITRFLQRRFAHTTDRCLTISDAVGAYAHQEMGIATSRIHTLYNPLPSDRFELPDQATVHALRRELNLSDDARVVSVIGRLSQEKGHEPFLRSLPAWIGSHPHVRMLIIGDGPTRRACEEIVRRSGLDSAVQFIGHRDDVPVCVALSDVIAVPSIHEGLGYVALEAMAASRPVAALSVGGIPEIIEHEKNGLLAKPGDIPALLSHIDRLLTEPELAKRLSVAGRERASDFSMDHHVHELIEHYQAVTNRVAS